MHPHSISELFGLGSKTLRFGAVPALQAMQHMLKHAGDDGLKNKLWRLVSVWEERKVFGSQGVGLKKNLEEAGFPAIQSLTPAKSPKGSKVGC